MRITQKRTEGEAGDRATRRIGAALRITIAGVGVACAMSGAGAAGPVGSNGVVRFTGALVERYDVGFETPPAAIMEGRNASGGATATLHFDAHGRRLPGAHVALLGLDGAPLGRPERSGIRATWRDAADGRAVSLPSDGVHRVGPYGGSLMLAAADRAAGAPEPVVIRIRHP
ncbi:thioesterase [Burkholderia pseudomultivorans]|uniref:Thioesterase n=1 Tax=Burkholderia pseudomultivorans TaxID=1207504 RepID=A0A6P2PBZ2_9BURK|nr:thioesterase [Burkholderia pseudomultivorans]